MMGSLPGFICNGITQAVKSWFPVTSNNATDIEITKAYVESDINNYFWILFGIVVVFGIGLNLLLPVKNWVESVIAEALDATIAEFSDMGADDTHDGDDDKAIESFEEGEGNDDEDGKSVISMEKK
jgi:hypothetical protein